MSTLPEAVESRDLVISQPLPPDRHPAAVYLAHLAPGGRRTMLGALNTVAGILTSGQQDAQALNWGAIRYQHTQAVRTALAERYAPATANKALAALRGTLKECWRLGLMTAEDYHRAVDVPPVRGSTLPKGRALSSGELRILFQVCAAEKTPGATRDAALMAVLYGAGMRRSEAVSLDLEDYNAETGELRIRSGKGHKERLVYASNGSALALEAWLKLRGQESGPLFCPVNKGGRIHLRRMTDQVVMFILRKRASQAGVQAFSPHDMRRTFISDLLDAGADIATVQHLAGHANVQTTARYDRRGEAAKKKATELLYVPFMG